MEQQWGRVDNRARGSEPTIKEALKVPSMILRSSTIIVPWPTK